MAWQEIACEEIDILETAISHLNYAGVATDLNVSNSEAIRFYGYRPTATNNPGTGYGYLMDLRFSDTSGVQIAYEYNTNKIFKRNINSGGTWGDWKLTSDVPLPITSGGTGATDRINAGKALFNSNVTSPNMVLGLTTGWASTGYTTMAQLRAVLGCIQFIGSLTDLNTSNSSGVYCFYHSGTAAGRPADAYGFVLEFNFSAASAIQVDFTHDNTKIYKRIRTQPSGGTPTWSAWKSLTFA